jgi:hypothetical protein
MDYNVDRLAYLSGVCEYDEYFEKVDAEYSDKSGKLLSDKKSGKLLSEGYTSASSPMMEEARLRKVIREELRSILSEIQSEKDEVDIARAQKSKSATTALGFAGVGFRPSKKSQRSSPRGPGGMRGFSGPGFW